MTLAQRDEAREGLEAVEEGNDRDAGEGEITGLGGRLPRREAAATWSRHAETIASAKGE